MQWWYIAVKVSDANLTLSKKGDLKKNLFREKGTKQVVVLF